MSLPQNQLFESFCKFVIEEKEEEDVLFSLNNYNKRHAKLTFLRNCVWFCKKFVDHLIFFENDFFSSRKLLQKHLKDSKRESFEDSVQQFSKLKNLPLNLVSKFILDYAIFNEDILNSRINLQKFLILQNQTGENFEYKGKECSPESNLR